MGELIEKSRASSYVEFVLVSIDIASYFIVRIVACEVIREVWSPGIKRTYTLQNPMKVLIHRIETNLRVTFLRFPIENITDICS